MTPLPDQFRLDDLLVDLVQLRVTRNEARIALPKLSLEVLLALVRAAPKVLSVDDLMSSVWPGLVVNPETVAQRIKLLRDALGDDPRAPRYIESLRGHGYRLLPQVRPVESAESGVPTPTTGPPPSPALPERGAAEAAAIPEAAPRVTGRRAFLSTLAALILLGLAATTLWLVRGKGERQAPGSGEAVVSGLPSRTVAVMPFDDLSLNHDNGQLALALPEMVLQRLGSVKDLMVIARSSSFAFQGQQVDAREIGRRLEVRYLVEGALQRVDNRLRVTTQLIDAETGKQVRALSFDRNLSDVFELQDEIAAQLAAVLQVQLMGADLHRVDRSKSTSLEAYLDYLEAQALMTRWLIKDVDTAVTRLEHAVKLDPKFALAYAELARARSLADFLRRSRNIGADRFMPLVNKALELDPQLGEAYAVRGYLRSESDPAAAEADFRHGIELAPNYGPGYEMYGEALGGLLNKPQDAIAMIERAMLIDPMAPRNYYMRGMYFYGQDQVEEAEPWFLRALTVGPDFAPASARLAQMRWSRKKMAEAVGFIERALRADTQSPWIADQACEMYLDLTERQAAATLLAGSATLQCAIMLDAFDGHAAAIADRKIDPDELDFIPAYAYWSSLTRAAIERGRIDATIASLRKRLHFESGSETLSLADHADLGPPIYLAHLLKVKNDQTSLKPVAAALFAWADRREGPKGPVRAAARLLSGDREAALQHLITAVHREHRLTWWVAARDPVLDELQSDPRFQELLALERQRVKDQQLILERMRRAGDVPRRDGKDT